MTTFVEAAGGGARLSTTGHGLVRLTWVHGAAVQEEDALEVVERISHLMSGSPYALLIDVREMVSISLRGHHVFARNPRVLASATLGAGPMDRMLSAGSEQAGHPAQYFLSELEAMRWLRSHLPAAPTLTPHSPAPTAPQPAFPAA